MASHSFSFSFLFLRSFPHARMEQATASETPKSVKTPEEERKEKVEQLKALGNTAFQAKKYATAVTYYSNALAYDPNNAVLFSNRAAAHLGQKNFALAAKDADRCISIDPSWAKGYFRKAQILLGLDCFHTAHDFLLMALRVCAQKNVSGVVLNQREIEAEIHHVTKNFNAQLRSKTPDIIFQVKWFGANKGRGLIAERDVKIGETVVVDIPLVAARYAPPVDTPETVCCAHCFRSLLHFNAVRDLYGNQLPPEKIPKLKRFWKHYKHTWRANLTPTSIKEVACPHGCGETYCSSQCLQSAEAEYHSLLCKGRNPRAKELFDFALSKTSDTNEPQLYVLTLISRLIALQVNRIKEALQKKRKGTTGGAEGLTAIEVAQICDAFRVFSCPRIQTVWQTSDQKKQELHFYVSKLRECFSVPATKEEVCPAKQLCETAQVCVNYLPALFSERSFEQMFVQISMNALKFNPKGMLERFSETAEGGGGTQHPHLKIAGRNELTADWRRVFGTEQWPGSCAVGGLFPILSLVNHSDAPNCIISDSFEDATVALRTIAPVQAGEEFTFDYVLGTTNESDRKQLKSEYLIED